MKLRAAIALCFATLAPPACLAQAADPDLARNLAATCASCHGSEGRAEPGSGMDTLAGQSKAGLLQKLAAFKAGIKPATIMHQIAKGYTDEQLALIADYFATRKQDER